MRALFAFLLLTSFAAAPAGAATFIVINTDSPGEGLNDATEAAPVGGNTGTTRGQQRLQVVERAAAIWGELLRSNITIRVEARFDPMRCEMNSAALGFAGPTSVFAQFTGAPLDDVWYPSALGDSVAGQDGQDLDPGASDLQAMFNSNIDTGCFLGSPMGWYYGLDSSPPAGQNQLLLVALHELAHGLGVSISTNIQTGAKLNGLDDVYSRLVEDHTTGKLFPQMTDTERLAALTRSGELHWIGQNVRSRSDLLTAGRTGDHVHLHAPPMLQQGGTAVHFDTSVTPDELMEPFFSAASIRDLTEAMFEDIGWGMLGDVPSPTPTGTPTAIPTATASRSPSATSTPTRVAATATATVTRTATLLPTATSTATRTATPRPTIAPGDPGDADCDGRLRVADVLAVVEAIAAAGEPACAGADADESGEVAGGDVGAAIHALFD